MIKTDTLEQAFPFVIASGLILSLSKDGRVAIQIILSIKVWIASLLTLLAMTGPPSFDRLRMRFDMLSPPKYQDEGGDIAKKERAAGAPSPILGEGWGGGR